MDRRRARGARALLRRVRWGNVGRLAALLAAGFLIAGGASRPDQATAPRRPWPSSERRERAVERAQELGAPDVRRAAPPGAHAWARRKAHGRHRRRPSATAVEPGARHRPRAQRSRDGANRTRAPTTPARLRAAPAPADRRPSPVSGPAPADRPAGSIPAPAQPPGPHGGKPPSVYGEFAPNPAP